MDCLSRMRGNLHVRFLGEGGAARHPPYPTYDEGSIPFTRSSLLFPHPFIQNGSGSSSSGAGSEISISLKRSCSSCNNASNSPV